MCVLEVLGEAVDALGQERDLDLGRAGVAFVHPELLDQALLPVDGKRHGKVSSNRLAPETHPQGGFKKTLFCQQIRSEGYHGARPEVKLASREPCPGGLHVPGDLSLEILDRGEPHLLAEVEHEVETHPSAVEIAREIQQMRLDRQGRLRERRAHADVDDGRVDDAIDVRQAAVHAARDEEVAVGRRGSPWESPGSARGRRRCVTVPADRVGPSEEPGRRDDVTPLQGGPDLASTRPARRPP